MEKKTLITELSYLGYYLVEETNSTARKDLVRYTFEKKGHDPIYIWKDNEGYEIEDDESVLGYAKTIGELISLLKEIDL